MGGSLFEGKRYMEARGQFQVLLPRSHSPCVLRQVLSLGLGAHSLGQADWLVNPSDLQAHASSELGLQGDAITYDFSQQCRSEVKTSHFHGGNFTNGDRPSAQGKWLNQLCLTGEQKSEMYIRKTKFWRQNKNTFKIIHKKDPFKLKASTGFSSLKAQPQQTFSESLTCIHQVPAGFASLQRTQLPVHLSQSLRPLLWVFNPCALTPLCQHKSSESQPANSAWMRCVWVVSATCLLYLAGQLPAPLLLLMGDCQWKAGL